MNMKEFYEEFNLLFNNITSNKAPGLTLEEISAYLTKGEYYVEDLIYSEYEKSEEARKKLSDLIRTKRYVTETSDASLVKYNDEWSHVYPLDNEVRYIVNELIKYKDTATGCDRGKIASVSPVIHDEVNRVTKNPFRFNTDRTLRLDISHKGKRCSEILSLVPQIEYYQVRYVKTAEPIVLTDDVFSSGGTQEVCELNEILHRQVVEVAAQFAAQDYKS